MSFGGAAVCVFGALAVPVCRAQEFRASISGVVTDQSGAAVAGARASAVGVERNVRYESVTNSAGRYSLISPLPGQYSVTVEKPRFKKFVRESVSLLAEDHLAIDIKLELGPLTDAVTVSGRVSPLQTENAIRQATIENRILESVPAAGAIFTRCSTMSRE